MTSRATRFSRWWRRRRTSTLKRKHSLVVRITKETHIQSPIDVSIPVALACFMGAGGGGGGIDPPVLFEGAVAVGPPLCSTKFLMNSWL